MINLVPLFRILSFIEVTRCNGILGSVVQFKSGHWFQSPTSPRTGNMKEEIRSEKIDRKNWQHALRVVPCSHSIKIYQNRSYHTGYWSFRKSSFGIIRNGCVPNEFLRSRSLGLNHDRFDHRVDGSAEKVIFQVENDREVLPNRSTSMTSGNSFRSVGSCVDGLRGEVRIFP